MEIFLTRYRKEKRLFSFDAKDLKDWESWRRGFRGKLSELIGLEFFERSELCSKVLEKKRYPDYTREKAVFRSDPHTLVPAYVLIPTDVEGRVPVMVAVHGHGYGKDDLVGIWEDGSDRVEPVSRGYHKDLAPDLVKRKLLVVVPEQSGFGERRTREDINRRAGAELV